MSRVEKAAEPSMEEILASIRKIISEEPAGTRPTPPQANAVLQAKVDQPSASRKVTAQPSGLDDVLDDLGEARSSKPAAQSPLRRPPSNGAEEPAGWSFTRTPTADGKGVPVETANGGRQPAAPQLDTSRPFTLNPPVTVTAGLAPEAPRRATDLGAVVPGRTEQGTEPQRALLDLDLRAERRGLAAPGTPLPAAPQKDAAPKDKADAVLSREPALAVPHTTVPFSGIVNPTPSTPVGSPLKPPGQMNGSINGSAAHADKPALLPPAPELPPTKPLEAQARDVRTDPVPQGKPAAPAAPVANSPTPAGLMTRVVAGAVSSANSGKPAAAPADPIANAGKPAATASNAQPQIGAASGAKNMSSAAKPTPSAPAADTGSERASAPGGVNGSSHKPAAPESQINGEQGSATAPQPAAGERHPLLVPAGAPASAEAAPVSAPSAPISPAPAPMAPATVQTPLVAAAAQVLAPASASSVDGVRTLEDTVAELLRPMLRQWLDANMPRIVEKALRVELAESAKKKH
jgi:cell pole-organizing protein PopZ